MKCVSERYKKLGNFENCLKPFRIPFAGKVDIVCFDKTGTLTQDKLIVKGVAGLDDDNPTEIHPTKNVPSDTMRVLAGAHSLHMGEKLIGDPLEISILDDLEWTLKGDHVMPLNKKTSPINTFKIEKKFHFSSALARMSTIVCQSDSNKYYAVVKGSAEEIKKRLSNVPSWYDECHKSLARDGHR